METVKIKDIKTGAIKVVKKSLASDYLGTGNFVLYDEKKEERPRYYRREEKENA